MAKDGFQDNFSKQAKTYSKYRPTYPAALFEYLKSLTDENELAWDCATGNGQSALSLTEHYKKVYATDASEAQLNNAIQHKKITYKVEKAEQTALKDKSVDLITVAQALHWFDFDAFYKEAKRVLKQNGVLAAWTYGLPQISPEINAVLQHFHDDIVGEFWQYENTLITKEYSTIPFPFNEISHPAFKIKKAISQDELMGLLNSWSAVQKYKDKKGKDPVLEIDNEIKKRWAKGDKKMETSWKIILKVGKNE